MNSKTRKESFRFPKFQVLFVAIIYLYMHVDTFVDICKVLLNNQCFLKKTLQIHTLAFYLTY